MSLEIRVAGGSLDLPPNAEREFYITKQLHDLHDLETRNGDFTKTLLLPYTPNNDLLLYDILPKNVRHAESGVAFLPCEILLQGVPAIEGARMRVEEGDRRMFEITIFSTDIDFFNQLHDQPLSDLDWSTLRFNWNAQELALRSNATSGVIFPRCAWTTNQSIDNYINNQDGNAVGDAMFDMQVPTSGFWLFVREALNRIFNNLNGLTVNFDTLGNIATLDALIFACPMPLIFDGYTSGTGYNGFADLTQENVLLNNNVPIVTVQQVADNIGFAAGIWTVQVAGNSTNTVNIEATWVRRVGTPNASVTLMQNNLPVDILRVPLARDGDTVRVSFTRVVNAAVGDTFWLRLFTLAQGSLIFSTMTVQHSITKAGAANPVINVQDYVPKTSQRDFVKGVFNMFHIVPKQKDSIINLHYWDTIPEAASLTRELDVGQPIKESALFDGYSRQNFMRYTPNNLVVSNRDSYFTMDNPVLDFENDAVVLPFTPIDASIQGLSYGAMPNYDIDKEDKDFNISWAGVTFTTTEPHGLALGDYLYVGGVRTKVVGLGGNLIGTTDVGGPAGPTAIWYRIRFSKNATAEIHLALRQAKSGTFNIVDGNELRLSQNPHAIAFFAPAVTWPELMRLYYKNFANSVRSPYTIQAWFDIDVLDFIEMDQLAPIHIPSLGGTFYVNRIEQYKTNNLVRMELLQVGETDTQPAGLTNLEGAYNSAFAGGFNNFPETETP